MKDKPHQKVSGHWLSYNLKYAEIQDIKLMTDVVFYSPVS